jgi:hypothetical protein
LKAHSKRGRVRKCTTYEIRAQIHVRKEKIGLEGALSKR